MIAELQDDVCPECKGTGELSRRTYIRGVADVVELCPDCNGTGSVLRCGDCREPLQLVRPGKHQCMNRKCPSKRKE